MEQLGKQRVCRQHRERLQRNDSDSRQREQTEGEDDGRPSDELATFLSEHGRKWLPAFMKAVIAESREAPAGDPYGALAHLGLVILSLTEFDTTEAL